MIKSVIVDTKQTFDGPVVFLGCEQKMVRQDKKNPASPMVPAPGQWTVSLMVRVKSDDGKVGRENINVTMESPTQPCTDLEEFDKVELEDLQYNVMTSERGAAMAFWRVKAVREHVPSRSANGAVPFTHQ
jgi:hypothetical protein